MNPENKEKIFKLIPRAIFLIFILLLAFRASNISTEHELLEQVRKIEAEKKTYLMGMFDPSKQKDFVLVSPENAFGADNMYLRKETYEAFIQMRAAAKADGVDLKIASATRNFDYQKKIWDEKWAELDIQEESKESITDVPDELRRFRKILEFSSAPGASRHHWGTDLDINRINPLFADSQYDSIIREKIYSWLVKNASRFGFCQTYTPRDENRKTGYNEERWHWSYIPLARIFTQEYKNLIKNEDIKGFLGDKFVSTYDLVNNYVLGINPECM